MCGAGGGLQMECWAITEKSRHTYLKFTIIKNVITHALELEKFPENKLFSYLKDFMGLGF